MSRIVEKRDAEERAREATKAFRRMLPNLNGYARAITGNRKIVIQVSPETNGGTDGKTIFMRPPIKLGDKTPHNKALCDKIDENGFQLCEACRVREYVLATIYHEIAHIAYDSFSPVRPQDAAEFTKHAAAELGTKYARGVVERVEKMSRRETMDYLRLAMELSPFLHMILNCLEDARINARMGEARPGVRRMMQAQLSDVMSEGVEVPNGRGGVRMEHWRDRPTNAQVIIGLFFKSSRYDYASWLSDEIVAVLDDEVLTDLCEQVYNAKGPHQTYALAIKSLARLRELGYCRSDKDPEDEDEDEAGAPEAGEGSKSDSSPEADSDSGSGHADRADTEERGEEGDESSSSDGDDGAPGDDEARGEGGGPDSDNSASPDQASESPAESGDSGTERSASDSSDLGGSLDADEGDSGEESSRSREDESEGDSGSRDDEAPADPEGGLGSDRGTSSETMDSDGTDSSGPDADHAGERESEEVGDGEADGSHDDGPELGRGERSGDADQYAHSDGSAGAGADTESADASGDDGGAPGSPGATTPGHGDGSGTSHGGSPHDSGEEEAHEPNLGTGGIHDFIDDLTKVLGHAEGYEVGQDGHFEEFHHDEESPVEERAVEVAIVQAEHFDEFSRGVSIVNIYEHMDRNADAWKYSDNPGFRRRFGGDCDPSESILGPALLRMRVTFSENKRAHETLNLKAGRVNARSLGKRAWGNDERLFKKKTKPTKRDYSVVIGMDISGSTVGGEILAIEKKAVMAQAELLHRIGVRFSVWAHTGGFPTSAGLTGYSLEMYCIKDFNEPWSNKARESLRGLNPVAANLDGHTMEFYRKQLDRETTTDRVIMYYTDGQMPLENGIEELEILQREIKLCAKKGYTVLGVGIQNDDPVKHGLDTVRVDSEADVVKVVRHLESRLER